ncbi:MAG: hypothetical protein WC628_05335 [Candidatus Omnitrophota bacterium]
MTTTLYFKRLLSISLLSIAFALAVAPCFAESPKAVSKDNIRLANYVKVIKGYLDEVINTLNSSGEPGKEYVTKLLLQPDAQLKRTYAGIGDYLPFKQGALTREYASFTKAVDDIQADFDTHFSQLAEGQENGANGALAFRGMESELLRYQKMSESEYDLYNPGVNGAGRPGKKQALVYYKGLKTRNDNLVKSLKAYLEAVKQFSETNLTCKAGEKAPDELFQVAENIAKFSYNATKRIRGYQLTLAQKRYQRDEEFSKAYEDYYNQCYNDWINSPENLNYTYFNTKYYFWDGADYITIGNNPADSIVVHPQERLSVRRYNFKRISWDTCSFSYDYTLSGETRDTPLTKTGLSGVDYPARAIANKPVRDKAIIALNSILLKYKPYFPYNQPFTAYDESDGTPNILGSWYEPAQNHAPVADVGEYPDKQFPYSYQLRPIQAYDADRDPISYRWVITHIPETGVRSLDYVLYQKLSDSQAATLKPDVVGTGPTNDWEVTLELNDGKDEGVATLQRRPTRVIATAGLTNKPAQAVNTPGTLTAKLNPNRRILWIQHSNGPYDEKTGLGISLEKYKPNKDTRDRSVGTITGKIVLCGPYYLEVMHGKAGVFFNRNDAGMPVDKDTSFIVDNKDGSCFSLMAPSNNSNRRRGMYDGFYGSSDLSSPQKYPLGDFTLKSASEDTEPVPITVMLLDNKITELVLANSDCPYGRSFPTATKSGTYSIQQWVNFGEWLNMDGKGFKLYPNKEPLSGNYPGWFGQLVADTSNEITAILPYIKLFEVKSGMGFGGTFSPGQPDRIRLNSTDGRLNRKYIGSAPSGFGFQAKIGSVQAVVRHELHHAYRYWCYKDGAIPNIDQDGLPGGPGEFPLPSDYPEIIGEKTKIAAFEYILDSADNLYGGTGAKVKPEYQSFYKKTKFPLEYQYEGDREPDVPEELIVASFGGTAVTNLKPVFRRFAKSFVLDDNFYRNGLTIDLPKNVPIAWEYVRIAIVDNPPLVSKYIIMQNKYYTCEIKDRHRTNKLIITFLEQEKWKQGLEKCKTNKIYISYGFTCAVSGLFTLDPWGELDAERVVPSDYTGISSCYYR